MSDTAAGGDSASVINRVDASCARHRSAACAGTPSRRDIATFRPRRTKHATKGMTAERGLRIVGMRSAADRAISHDTNATLLAITKFQSDCAACRSVSQTAMAAIPSQAMAAATDRVDHREHEAAQRLVGDPAALGSREDRTPPPTRRRTRPPRSPLAHPRARAAGARRARRRIGMRSRRRLSRARLRQPRAAEISRESPRYQRFSRLSFSALAVNVYAQATGRVSGRVLDQTGAALPGVAIDLVVNSRELTTTTDEPEPTDLMRCRQVAPSSRSAS